MEQLIPVINKLQDVFATVGAEPIDLPQIVVVGSQSSGKSSVLENIVGRDFLPRGSGIVTRRPLVLQLIHLPDPNAEEVGEFLHKPKERFTDFAEIKAEIERETDRVTGLNKGVSEKSINLKIYSPNVVSLTLVDLPGLTKVPVGDQPQDIEKQIRKMIMHFITKPATIILAVTAANTDLANSDALQLARDADPEGHRTIGVLTKIDLMDRGVDAMEMLAGKVYPLALGYVGVINRSQEDINNGVPINKALQKEADFFRSHPVYRSIASRLGTPFLASNLKKILINHIKNCLPDLKAKVQSMLSAAEQELLGYGDQFVDVNKGALVLNTVTNFTSQYRDAIEGKLTEDLNELYGGARINYSFRVFDGHISSINPFDGLSESDIKTTIRNASGPRSSLFIPEAAFEMLVKQQIMKLEEPSLQCIELVFDELQRVVGSCHVPELERFTPLKDKLTEEVNVLLQKYRTPTRAMIRNLINIELAYINTKHPDFESAKEAIVNFFARQQEDPNQPPVPLSASQALHAAGPIKTVPEKIITKYRATPQEKFEIELIQSLIRSYFDIVRKNVTDSVPKAIMRFMVNESKEHMQNELVARLYKEELFESLLSENPEIAAARKSCKELIDVLRKASAIINEVRDFNLR